MAFSVIWEPAAAPALIASEQSPDEQSPDSHGGAILNGGGPTPDYVLDGVAGPRGYPWGSVRKVPTPNSSPDRAPTVTEGPTPACEFDRIAGPRGYPWGSVGRIPLRVGSVAA